MSWTIMFKFNKIINLKNYVNITVLHSNYFLSGRGSKSSKVLNSVSQFFNFKKKSFTLGGVNYEYKE